MNEKMSRRIWNSLRLMVFMLVLVQGVYGCGTKAGTVAEPQGDTAEKRVDADTERVLKNETGSGTEKAQAEGKKYSRCDYKNLPKAMEEAGFSFRSVEKLGDGYEFDDFSVGEGYDSINGTVIGESYTQVKVRYSAGSSYIEVETHPIDGELFCPGSYIATEEIGGTQVHLTDYIIRMCGVDYEMTKEDYSLMEKGNIGFSSDGSPGNEVIEDEHFYGAYWEEKGICYKIRAAYKMTLEDTKALTEEFLLNAK